MRILSGVWERMKKDAGDQTSPQATSSTQERQAGIQGMTEASGINSGTPLRISMCFPGQGSTWECPLAEARSRCVWWGEYTLQDASKVVGVGGGGKHQGKTHGCGALACHGTCWE